MTEIRPDQTLALKRIGCAIEFERKFDLGVANLKHPFGLPVAFRKIVENLGVFLIGVGFAERNDVIHQLARARTIGGGCLPTQVKGTQHDPRRVGVQPLVKYAQRRLRQYVQSVQFDPPVHCPPPGDPGRPPRQPWHGSKAGMPEWIRLRN